MLELTEQSLIVDVGAAVTTVQSLRTLGSQFAIGHWLFITELPETVAARHVQDRSQLYPRYRA
jgi:hypothetical protein